MGYLIQLNLTLLLCYLLYKCIFQFGTTLQARRIFILFSFIFSAGVPLLSQLNMINSPVITNILTTVQIEPSTINTQINTADKLSGILYFVYAVVVTIMILWSMYKLFLIMRMIHRSKKEHSGDYYIIKNNQITTPASFFKYIFIPSQLDATSCALIIKHEQVHAKQWHSVDVLFVEILQWFCWFNPAVWLLQKELRLVHEYIADRTAGNEQPVAYQQLLVQFHFSTSVNTITNHFNHSSNLKRRIIMFNQKFSRVNNVVRFVFVLPFFLVTGIYQSGAQVVAEEKVEQSDAVTNPEFPGGINALMTYLGENIKYPESAKSAKIQGTSIIEFTVSKNGSIKNVSVKKSADADLDAEAIRVVASMPKWTPGEKEGKKVDVVQIIPIKFALN